MITESLKEKIDQWLDGDLPVEEEAQMQQWLEGTPEALEFLSDRALLHQMLAKSAAWDLSSLKVNELPQTRPWFAHPWMWVSSAAVAGLVLASMLFLPNVVASPVELVQKTLAEYRPGIDRRYNVNVELESGLYRSRFPRRTPASDSKLWARGSSFVQIFQSSSGELVWGRNSEGAVWFTIAGKSAAIFEANEIPAALQELCDLRSLEMTSLLESLLRDYDLEYINREQKVHTLLARPRAAAGHSKYGAVEIEIDPQWPLVRRITLERLKDKRSLAVVSFALEQIQQRDASFYELQSHLQEDAFIYDRGSRFGKRSELLREFLLNLRSPKANP